MVSHSVTFDSTVWENIVDEEKRRDQFGGIITMENVQREKRKKYIGSYKAPIIIQLEGEEVSRSESSEVPELSNYLKKHIPEALKLGFRFIKLPRIGAVRLDIDDKYFKPDNSYSLKERIDRSFEYAKLKKIL
jgi:hypothetical protein